MDCNASGANDEAATKAKASHGHGCTCTHSHAPFGSDCRRHALQEKDDGHGVGDVVKGPVTEEEESDNTHTRLRSSRRRWGRARPTHLAAAATNPFSLDTKPDMTDQA